MPQQRNDTLALNGGLTSNGSAVQISGMPRQPSVIRRATPADASALAGFARRTFIETYVDYPDPGKLRRHAALTFAPNRQARELADAATTTLLAFSDRVLCGFAQVRPGPAPTGVAEADAIELHRLYVDRRWHGRGVGQELLAQVHCVAIASSGALLWLKVWEHNARAIAFYRKSGFVDAGVADFFVCDDRLTDRVLSLPLTRS